MAKPSWFLWSPFYLTHLAGLLYNCGRQRAECKVGCIPARIETVGSSPIFIDNREFCLVRSSGQATEQHNALHKTNSPYPSLNPTEHPDRDQKAYSVLLGCRGLGMSARNRPGRMSASAEVSVYGSYYCLGLNMRCGLRGHGVGSLCSCPSRPSLRSLAVPRLLSARFPSTPSPSPQKPDPRSWTFPAAVLISYSAICSILVPIPVLSVYLLAFFNPASQALCLAVWSVDITSLMGPPSSPRPLMHRWL